MTAPQPCTGANATSRRPHALLSFAAGLVLCEEPCFLAGMMRFGVVTRIVPTAAPSVVPNTQPRTIKALRPRVLISHAHRINPVIRGNPKPPMSVGLARAAVAVLQRWGLPERLSRDSLRTG